MFMSAEAAAYAIICEHVLKLNPAADEIKILLQAENRTLDFHVHEKSDDMFFCIEGEFNIEFADAIVHLCEGYFNIVPKGTSHKPVYKGLVSLLIEKDGALTEENTGGTYGDIESDYTDNELAEMRREALHVKAFWARVDKEWIDKAVYAILSEEFYAKRKNEHET